MRRAWSFAAVLVLTAAACCVAQEAPDALLPSIERTDVVVGQGFFPVALRLRDGRIAVVLRGGAGHLGIEGRLDVVFSSDDGKTWTEPGVVNDSPVDDRNPALGQAKDGTLVVGFYRTATYTDKGGYDPRLDKPRGVWVTRSQDGGQSWSEPTEIDVSDIGDACPYGKILTMPDGSMLMCIYGPGIGRSGKAVPGATKRGCSFLYRSTDDGKTWSRYAVVAAGGFNETGLARLPSGTLVAAMRTRRLDVWTARSSDGGKTWSEPAKLTPKGVHPPDLCVLPDGRVLLATGYRLTPYGVRGVVGDGEGNFDWQRHFVLVNDSRSSDCGYPSSVVLKDGRALTVYYAVGCAERPGRRVYCGAVAYRPPTN